MGTKSGIINGIIDTNNIDLKLCKKTHKKCGIGGII